MGESKFNVILRNGIISTFIGNGRYGTLEHFAQCSNAIIRGGRLINGRLLFEEIRFSR